jgi:hypothetical protein
LSGFFVCASGFLSLMLTGLCGDIKSKAKESQRIPADRLGAASAKT